MLSLLERLEDRLSNDFERINIGDNTCFLLENGNVAHLVVFTSWKCIVVEYSDNLEDAKKNIGEDGDQFYIDEMSEEDLYKAIKKEIIEESGQR